MSDTWIKDGNGKPLARIRVEPSDYQRIYKIDGYYLGMFNPNTNTTHYRDGAVFCRGNALAALIDF